jgi:hypothetical protein
MKQMKPWKKAGFKEGDKIVSVRARCRQECIRISMIMARILVLFF